MDCGVNQGLSEMTSQCRESSKHFGVDLMFGAPENLDSSSLEYQPLITKYTSTRSILHPRACHHSTPSPRYRFQSYSYCFGAVKADSFTMTTSTTLSPQRAAKENRPPSTSRHPTAPSIMQVNGHFAGVGETPTKEQYEHGIQVINEDQEFKYHLSLFPLYLYHPL